jgi:hypothetical protein
VTGCARTYLISVTSKGRDFTLDERYADSRPERLAEIVAELVRLKVDLIRRPGAR